MWINPPQSATVTGTASAEAQPGTQATLTVGLATSDNGEHLAVVEEMLRPDKEEKYSLFPNGELSHNA